MSDYSSMATLQNNSPTAGFAAALQRARLVAAKLESGSSKRPLEEGDEPSAKKLASLEAAYNPPQPPMGDKNSNVGGQVPSNNSRLGGSGPPPPPNMMSDQAIIEYIRVPDNMVGLIIGRGGEQITRLQAESGCKIQMAPDSGGQAERMCTLTGAPDAIQRAKDLVNQIVNHRGRENAPKNEGPMGGMGPGPGGPMGGGGMPPMRGGGGGGGGGLAMTDEIILPGPKVGLIIGKNGKTIKQLQEQSGAKMVVIQDGPNTEYEKPLRISGDPAKVEHAKQLVYELLADKDMGQSGGQRQFDDFQVQDQGNGLAANSTEVLVPKVAVGVVIGRGGDMIKKIQADTGARVQFHQERDDGPGDKRCYLQGKPHQVEAARQMIEDLISSVNRREQERPRGRGGARNGDRGDFGAWQDQPDVRVTFTVSNIKCGLIIGRGGEVIKQINAQSGAHCELDRRAQGADRNNRTFYIKGHPEAVESCKRIIMEKVGMPVNFIPDNGNGNGGNGNGNGNGGDFYGGGGGGPPAWGYNPHWHQQNNPPQPQAQVPVNPTTGQPDYSQQWIDYYRSLGMVKEAEAIEMQTKQQQQPQQQPQQPAATDTDKPDYTLQWIDFYRKQGLNEEADAVELHLIDRLEEKTDRRQEREEIDMQVALFAQCAEQRQQTLRQDKQLERLQDGFEGGQPSGPGGAAQSGADYSAQWADYYRSIGKVKEAEAIEAQIKAKQQQQQPIPQPQPPQPPQQSTPGPAPTPPAGQYPQYGAPMYGGYPGYAPYPYSQPEHPQCPER